MCLWVFGCKSMATCPMKNRHCEGVVTVDLSSCVSICVYGCHGVYRCMGVYRCKGYGCLREFIGVYWSLDVNRWQCVL